MEGKFTFDTLSAQESQEKKSRSLTKIEPSFFRYVANYLEQVEDDYRKEQSKNPSSRKVQFLGDELRNATNKAEELWKSREKKIVYHAQVAARKDPLPPPPENLTRDEAAFYRAMVELLRQQWLRFLPQRAGGSDEAAARHKPETQSARVQPAPEPKAPATDASGTGPDSDDWTIRALVDIPPFVGYGGKTYHIRKGEVLTLPRKLASVLKDRKQVSIVN